MARPADQLPHGEDALRAALIETRAKLLGAQALIEHLQLTIAKMKREHFGARSERSQRLLDQLELQLEELAAAAGEDEAKADQAGIPVEGYTRRQSIRRSFPAHLPRQRIVYPAPAACPCCGGSKLSKIGFCTTKTPSRHSGSSRPFAEQEQQVAFAFPKAQSSHCRERNSPCWSASL